eukprot:122169-Pelagomonas_calceolata.AAC.1
MPMYMGCMPSKRCQKAHHEHPPCTPHVWVLHSNDLMCATRVMQVDWQWALSEQKFGHALLCKLYQYHVGR